MGGATRCHLLGGCRLNHSELQRLERGRAPGAEGGGALIGVARSDLLACAADATDSSPS